MKHVFVESNWVFDYCSPEYLRKPDAQTLADRASKGELCLHVPSICLREGASSVRRKSQPKDRDVREFRRWAAREKKITDEDVTVVDRFLSQYVQYVTTDLKNIDDRLNGLVGREGIDIFSLTDPMLERVLSLRGIVPEDADLNPFDEAILAAVVVCAEGLRAPGETELWFCTLDSDLWPWTKDKKPRRGLERLYREAGFVDVQDRITVRSDFSIP